MRTALVSTVAMLALAGCGGGSGGGSYAQVLATTLTSVSRPASLDAGSLAKLAHDYSNAADRLEKLTPPAAVAQPHAQMVMSMRAYAVDLETASTLTTNAQAFASEMARAQADAQAWTSAFEAIRARGYATFNAS
jgi:hypothetical protein